jgi:two-component system KDP operon response regulator KdpE
MNKRQILVIDDEPQIRKLLDIALESHDYKVITAEDGKKGKQLAASFFPDLILLDLNLPDTYGLDLLEELTEWYNGPVIILSVIDQESEVVRALDSGATDYLTKPFRTAELMARIRLALKRSESKENITVLQFGDLELDLVARIVKKNGDILKLTATEYSLLVLFAKNEGRVLTHQYILKNFKGVGFQTETQYLRVFVGTLRKKIEDNPNKPIHILTENGVGYRFQ